MKKIILICILLLTFSVFAQDLLSPKTPTTDTESGIYEYPDITSFQDEDYIEYTWDEQTTIYPETEEFVYEITVKCIGDNNCATRGSDGKLQNGRIDTTITTSGSIQQVDKQTYHCAIDNMHKQCTHKVKFKLYQGPIGPKKPFFSMRSVC